MIEDETRIHISDRERERERERSHDYYYDSQDDRYGYRR
jgi:hypothetical protein